MQNFIEQSKYQAETISVVTSFAGELVGGDTITGTPNITITVYTGVDSNPSALLYGTPSVSNGQVVDQKIRQGISGVIYQITFTVQTLAGQTFDKECYLAILPDEDSAVPNWLPLWETTQLYPYQSGPDAVTSSLSLTHLGLAYYVIPPEYVASTLAITSATLIVFGSLTYNIPHEDVQSSLQVVSGTLVPFGSITYNIPYEGTTSNLAVLSGTLIATGLTYNIPHEDIQSSLTLISGTLV